MDPRKVGVGPQRAVTSGALDVGDPAVPAVHVAVVPPDRQRTSGILAPSRVDDVAAWLRRLRVVAVVLPVVAIVGIHVVRPPLESTLGPPRAHLLVGAVSALAVIAFSVIMFAVLTRGYRIMATQNHHLTTVAAVSTAVARRGDIAEVTEVVQEAVRGIPGITHAAVEVTPEGGSGGDSLGDRGTARLGEGVIRRTLTDSTGSIGSITVRHDGQWTSEHERLLSAVSDLTAVAVTRVRLAGRDRRLAVLAERHRLSREMHDNLAQVLATLHLRLRALGGRCGDETVGREIGGIADLCAESYQDVRESILALRVAGDESCGLVASLQRYARGCERYSGQRVRIDAPVEADLGLSPDCEVQVTRIVQEALTNARKHSDSDEVTVRIQRGSADVVIEIEDDGRGFVQDSAGGDLHRFGLRTMAERATLVGGALEVSSRPSVGTRVRLRVPRASAPAHAEVDR